MFLHDFNDKLVQIRGSTVVLSPILMVKIGTIDIILQPNQNPIKYAKIQCFRKQTSLKVDVLIELFKISKTHN